MSNGLITALIFVFALTIQACSGGTSGSGGGTASNYSCSLSSYYECDDYVGSGYTELKSQQSTACAGEGGTFSTSPCSTTNRAGSCAVGAGTASEYIIRYYNGSNIPTSTLQSSCGQLSQDGVSGQWTAGFDFPRG